MKFSVTQALAAGLVATTVSIPAMAGTGKAVTICKNEVAARYGEEARTKIHHVRTGKQTRVTLVVRGVTEDSFRVQCKVDSQLQVTEITDNLKTTAPSTVGG